MAKIYVASSWRNVFQQDVVDILRDLGHEVYYQNFYEFPKFRIKLLILILLHFNIVRIIY